MPSVTLLRSEFGGLRFKYEFTKLFRAFDLSVMIFFHKDELMANSGTTCIWKFYDIN